jgi:hypothetical protein
MDVHGVVDGLARMRSVTWYLTIAETTDGFSPRSIAPRSGCAPHPQIGVAGDARQRFLDALETADRQS